MEKDNDDPAHVAKGINSKGDANVLCKSPIINQVYLTTICSI